eukprot:COSAG02_NODE_7781_length_2848_cov_7.058931_3_plen_266_part_00
MPALKLEPHLRKGVEWGTQCFCGQKLSEISKRVDEAQCAVGCNPNGPHPDCACPGKPTEKCGGGMTMMVTEIVCEGNFGWTVVFLLSVVGVAYVGGGVAWGKHTGKVTATSWHPTMQMLQGHPHYSRWQDLHGLCTDGMRFARGWKGTQYSRIRDAPASQISSNARQDERAGRDEALLQQKHRSAKRNNGDGGGVRKEKHGKGAKKNTKANKTNKPDKQKEDYAAIENVREPETLGEAKERLLKEQRDDGVHSSQQRIKVVGING